MHYGLGRSYDLRYGFRLSRIGVYYIRTERIFNLRREVWSSLPQDEWDTARRKSEVDVEYCRHDPTINCTASEFTNNLRNAWIASLVSGALTIAAAAWLINVILFWRAPSRAAQ